MRTHRWFVTAQFARIVARRVVTAGSPAAWVDEWAPGTVTHAKAMGSLTTACGLRCETWPKMWDLAFEPDRIGSCPACSAAVSEHPDPRVP